MYQALYRKWRPQTFDEVVGQKHITETLKNQVKTGRLSHAYIFIGTRGTGKTTCARILARAVNCEHPVDGNPCGVCPACRGILDGSVLDVVELDAASNNSVDNVRALREEAVFSPATVKKRVYIVDEVHMLSTSAFNALLKILEEPPEHLMFILATTELQKVPATILSRCQRHSFKRIDAPAIAAYLMTLAQKEGFTLHEDAAQLIARLADGGVRDALSLLDQCSARETVDLDAVYSAMGLAGNRRTLALMDQILDKKTERVLKEFNALWMDGKDPAVLLTELSGLLRDTLMLKVAPKGGLSLISGGYDGESLKALAARLTQEEILCSMETLQNALAAMRQSANPKTTAELCLVSLCDNTLGESVSALRARVSRLEQNIKSGRFVPSTAVPDEIEEERPPLPEEEYPEPAPYEAPEPVPYEPPEPSAESVPPRSAPVEPPRAEEPAPRPKASGAEPGWEAICKQVAPTLTKDIGTRLGDPKSLRGRIEGGLLKLEVAPGFLHGRVNRQEVLAKFSAAASELCGRDIRAVVSELNDDAAPEPQKRSLEDLRGFKEVRFIDR